MIVYFTDRQLNIHGTASTQLPKGLTIIGDEKTEDVETGVAIFECTVSFDADTRAQAEACAEVGNYILRSHDNENEFYTIIDSEIDTKNQEIYVYAEDAGLDLLNEVVGEYAADKAYPITHYIEKFAYDSGFIIGVNEAASLTRKLSWDGEATAAERIASVATQFDGCEVSYSFDIKGLEVRNKYINIYKERGKDIGVQLRLNQHVDRIITKKSIANLATALQCTGGTPAESETPITLSGYKYDDGNFYVSGTRLYSREALKKWSRYQWDKEPNKTTAGGHIVRQFSYDTTSQKELCNRAISELKEICEMEVNYEVDITKFPENVKIGDRVNIIDDAGGLYLSTRILLLKTSIVEQTKTATLGEHLLKSSGISQKVADLAAQFAATAQTATRAYNLASTAATAAENAQAQADAAAKDAEAAELAASEAEAAANTATQAASEATEKANAAQEAVDKVESEVSSLETTVLNAQQAANNAQQAAGTAQTKANEAATAAQEAQTDADEAKEAATAAGDNAQTAIEKAEAAQGTAATAKSEAAAAQETAAAAKADAEAAQADIDALGDELETVSQTMTTDYARKTDLTESEARLQTQITQNAGQIESTATKVQEIDETANNAAEQAAQAQNTAQQAQNIANAATADAEAAQKAADDAAAAATAAQSEADTAKQAAATAQGVANKAAEDLAAAEADLATVTGRVDATEADIIAAREAVNAAKTAANNAQAEADLAAEKAATAQNTAETAVTNAANAQTAANNAADKATAAQAAADKAQGDATAAQNKANEAAAAAAAAQNTANTAKENATAAQNKANEAAAAAAAADQAAKDADAKAAQAQTDLETAQQNLANVTSRVGATEAEVEAAKAAVNTAQAAADKAKADAAAAQSTADTAKSNATVAQTAANNAKTAADNAQAAAEEAQEAAEAAQKDVDELAVRVTSAETKITQNSEKIALMATKEEVTETLGGYYKKEETESLIEQTSASIRSSVSSEITEKVNEIEIGGRNLLRHTGEFPLAENSNGTDGVSKYVGEGGTLETTDDGIKYTFSGNVNDGLSIPLVYEGCIESGEEITWSFEYRGNITKAGYFYLLQREYPNAAISLDSLISLESSESDWKKCTVTFSIPTANDRICYQALIFYATKYTTTDWIEIKKGTMKLEKGNKATDWAPAPEDLTDATQAAQSSADEARATADAAQSSITAAESIIEQLSNQISTLVTDENGASLMTQTADGGWTFSMGEIASALSSTSESLDNLVNEMGSVDAAVGVLNQAVSDLETLSDYIHIGTYNGQPCIELGEQENDFILRITNTEIHFADGTVIDREKMNINKARVKELEQGGFSWILHGNSMGLMWKGVES